MWSAIKRWFQKHKFFLIALLTVSLLVGILAPILCFCYPAVFAALIGFNVLGWFPFAFLLSMDLAASLPVLGLVLIGVTSVILTACTMLSLQLLDIGQHVWVLFFGKPEERALVHTSPYTNKYLQASTHFMDELVALENEESVSATGAALFATSLPVTDEGRKQDPSDTEEAFTP